MSESETKPFLSLSEMRSMHADLLRHSQAGMDEDQAAAIQTYIRRGAATGMILDGDNERRAAQNLLDYWFTQLLTGGRQAPDATLAPLDPEQFPDLSDIEAPYLGLDAFRARHQALFYGRDRLTAAIIANLEDRNLMAVLGPSGSGKSSLVMAGVLPALASGAIPGSEKWVYLPRIVPGSEILRSLVAGLGEGQNRTEEWVAEWVTKIAEKPGSITRLVEELYGDQTFVVLIDQFEEAFTLCLDVQQTGAYLDALLALTNGLNGRCKIILTMRTDFEEHVAKYPHFQAAFEAASFRLTPLSAREMRDVIEKPAERINLKFEDGVVDALIEDTLGEQAALPLLQFSLLKLWEHRKRNRITWEAYNQVGGGKRALQISADQFYNGLLVEDQQALRQIFLKLVTPGEGLEVTSKRIRRVDLYSRSVASDRIDRVLESLVEARLVRLTPAKKSEDEQVEVAHEALIRNWPTLIGWVEEARVGLRRRKSLTLAADEWQKLGQDSSALWSGLQLMQVQQFEDLSQLERLFVDASLENEKEAEIRELEQAQAQALAIEQEKRAEAERLRAEEASEAASKLRGRAIYLAGALGIAIILSILATSLYFQAQNNADIAAEAAGTSTVLAGQNELAAIENAELAEAALAGEQTAIYALRTATAALAKAESDRAIALQAREDAEQALITATAALGDAETARRSAEESLSRQYSAYAENVDDRSLSLLLALEALKKAETAEGKSALLKGLQRVLEFDVVRLTDEASTANGFHRAIAFHPNGQLLAAGRADGLVEMWDLKGQKTVFQPPTGLRHDAQGLTLDFSPDLKRPLLATGGGDGQIFLWDLDSNTFKQLITGPRSWVRDVAISPDGNLLAASRTNGTLLFFDISGDEPREAGVFQADPEKDGIYFTLAWSPDGLYLAAANDRAQAVIWQIRMEDGVVQQDEPVTRLVGNENHFEAISWVRKDLLVSGHKTGRVIFWDPLPGVMLGQGEHKETVFTAASSWDERFLITGSTDNNAILWDLETLELKRSFPQRSEIFAADFSPVENIFAVSVGGDPIFYEITTEQELGRELDSQASRIETMIRSSNGEILFAGENDQNIQVWEVLAGEERSQPFIETYTKMALAPVSGRIVIALPGGELGINDPQGERSQSFGIRTLNDTDSLAINSDETLVAQSSCAGLFSENELCESSDLYLWDMENGSLQRTIKYPGRITGMAFSQDGSLLALGQESGAIFLVDLEGKVVRAFPVRNQRPVISLAFSPDGFTLASGDSSGLLFLRDIESGLTLGNPLSTQSGELVGLAFTADGLQLVTGNRSGYLYAWDVSLDYWKQQACKIAGRNFSQEEWEDYFPGLPYDLDDLTCPQFPPGNE